MSVLASAYARPSPEFEDVRVRRGERSGLTMVVAVHRTVARRSLGGCRMWRYKSAADAVRDAEGLARSMSLKAAIAGLPLGGAKAVIALDGGEPPTGKRRRDILRDFAELVESFHGRYITAQDVGTSADDVAYLSGLTEHVTGRPVAAGGAGDPSPYTAHGVEVAIRASMRGSLAGRRIAVIGLGHVGGELARLLHQAGARLIVSDLDERKRVILKELVGARWVGPEEALGAEVDVLAPCALGGVLDRAAVEVLRAQVVAGAANNQLADDDIADALRDRGIVWAPDFVINSGGLIAVADELRGFDRDRVQRRIEGIADTLAEIFIEAARTGDNTLTAAKRLANERLEGGPDGDHL
jgi:leucine dehydrogenase